MKLYITIATSFSIKRINIYYFLDLSIDTNNYICHFNHFLISDNLQLMIIRDVHNQIATNDPSYQKLIRFIIKNYYWPGLKKLVKRDI